MWLAYVVGDVASMDTELLMRFKALAPVKVM